MVTKNVNNEARTPAAIATIYANYMRAFLKRADVQNGKRVSYHDNQDPDGHLRDENWVNLGDARVTTGFCVSFSQAILRDELFQLLLQSRNAQAKLVSIDIKEQFYGYCKPSYVFNKWHTAILVRDSGIMLILDGTCAQFGNAYVGKFVWDLNTWLNTFRSPQDTHKICDFNDNPINFTFESIGTNNYDQAMISITNALKDVITIDDAERKLMADFFLNGMDLLNRKLAMGNLTDADFKYMANVNKLLKQFNFTKCKEAYNILRFNSSSSMKTWLKHFIESEKVLPCYMTCSPTLNDSCYFYGFKPEDINKEATDDIWYIVFRMKDVICCDISNIIKHTNIVIPTGVKLFFDTQKDMYNGGKELPENSYGINKKTNTIFINATFG